MSKKLKRTDVGLFIKHLQENRDTFFQFITKDKKVHFAKPEEFRDKIFLLKTARGHSLKLPLQDITEIWQEEKANDQ
jgi:hypothetical protein